MTGIGLIGLGFMGRIHLGAYEQIDAAKLVAVSDNSAKRVAGDLSGGWANMAGGKDQLDMTDITGTQNWRDLLEMDEVDVVDICVPTPFHSEIAIAALEAGKHVICEKPMAPDTAEAQKIAEAAAAAKGYFMPAMCLRFWPHWEWLKNAVASGEYGRVLGAQLVRLGSAPAGWYRDGNQSGGALIDLHIHDIDFIYYLLGRPAAVHSQGYTQTSGQIDHVMTQYLYEGDDAPQLVVAAGGWLGEHYPFSMRYLVNFENATADYDSSRQHPLLLTHEGTTDPITVPEGDGYAGELGYFIDCVESGRAPERVTAVDGVEAVRIAEAERESINTHNIVRLS